MQVKVQMQVRIQVQVQVQIQGQMDADSDADGGRLGAMFRVLFLVWATTYAWKSGHHVIIESIVQYVRMHKIHKATNSPVNVRIYANVAFWPQAARPSFEFAFRERIVISATKQRSKSQRHGQWLPFQSV